MINANHQTPRWLLSMLLAAMSAIGALSIDAYMPSFGGIASEMHVGVLEMQQTLSAYLLAFSVMFLFHGALSDSYGRKPVLITGLCVFCVGTIGCALSQSITQLLLFRMLQGMASGSAMVISRAMIRDMFDETQAQKLMSMVTIWFGIAPVVGPIVGGALFSAFGWRSVFWAIAGFAVLLIVLANFFLHETLPEANRHKFRPRPLLHGYREVGSSRNFLLLCLAAGVASNGFFLYIASAPVYLTEHLHLKATEFAWLFIPAVAGIMSGAFISGRVAGKLTKVATIRIAFAFMASASVINLIGNYFWAPALPWAIVPFYIYTLGSTLAMPSISIMVMDMFPPRRGMAASLQTFVFGIINTLVAGILSPALSHHPLWLAVGMFCLLTTGLIGWLAFRLYFMPRVTGED